METSLDAMPSHKQLRNNCMIDHKTHALLFKELLMNKLYHNCEHSVKQKKNVCLQQNNPGLKLKLVEKQLSLLHMVFCTAKIQ